LAVLVNKEQTNQCDPGVSQRD